MPAKAHCCPGFWSERSITGGRGGIGDEAVAGMGVWHGLNHTDKGAAADRQAASQHLSFRLQRRSRCSFLASSRIRNTQPHIAASPDATRRWGGSRDLGEQQVKNIAPPGAGLASPRRQRR